MYSDSGVVVLLLCSLVSIFSVLLMLKVLVKWLVVGQEVQCGLGVLNCWRKFLVRMLWMLVGEGVEIMVFLKSQVRWERKFSGFLVMVMEMIQVVIVRVVSQVVVWMVGGWFGCSVMMFSIMQIIRLMILVSSQGVWLGVSCSMLVIISVDSSSMEFIIWGRVLVVWFCIQVVLVSEVVLCVKKLLIDSVMVVWWMSLMVVQFMVFNLVDY